MGSLVPYLWRLAKRPSTAIRADGVDLGDDDISAWVQASNHRPPAGRRVVLGELLDTQPELGRTHLLTRGGLVAALAPDAPAPPQPHPADDEPAGTYPPVVLADDHQLATAARASSLLGRVITLARWVDTARPVSRHAAQGTRASCVV